MILPGHLTALAALRRARVDYLMIGALALGHYAPDVASLYVTGDCDILVRPERGHLARALRTLRRRGFSLSINGEPLGRVDGFAVERLLKHRVAIRAEKESSLPIDLLLEAAGGAFADWWRERTHFRAGRARIPCASLRRVLRSKRAAGREKDKKLLALYQTALRGSARRL